VRKDFCGSLAELKGEERDGSVMMDAPYSLGGEGALETSPDKVSGCGGSFSDSL
jgi:hypothetical protein